MTDPKKLVKWCQYLDIIEKHGIGINCKNPNEPPQVLKDFLRIIETVPIMIEHIGTQYEANTNAPEQETYELIKVLANICTFTDAADS